MSHRSLVTLLLLLLYNFGINESGLAQNESISGQNEIADADLSRGDSLFMAGDLLKSIQALRTSYERTKDKVTAFKLAKAYALQAQFLNKAFEYLELADLDSMEPLWNADLYFMKDDERWTDVEEKQLGKLSAQVTGTFDKEYARQLLRIRMNEWVNRYQVMLAFRTVGPNSPITTALSQTMQRHHRDNEIQMVTLLDTKGWPEISQVGGEAAYAAGNVINHSDLQARQRFLPLLKAVCEKGEGDWSRYAHVLDRTELELGNPQVFGTQMEQNAETKLYEPRPIADPEGVEELRAEKGLESLKDQLDSFNEAMKRDFGS